uniref:Uncharacterized protein n=1 Tax=Moniliophthora roreri TaxID=221103 RepID=A0A0W0EUQ1_MONRR
MYFLSTVHPVTDFARGFAGFSKFGDQRGPKQYYAKIRVWSYVFREAVYLTNDVVADSLLVDFVSISRLVAKSTDLIGLSTVWGKKKKVIISPVILLTATTIIGYLFVWGFT